MRAWRAALWVSLLGLTACAKVPVMRGEIEGLQKLIAQADRNGAKRCAPRELALAMSHTTFAETELDQANMFRAEDHLIVARSNAQAAYDLSPATKCSERRFVMDEPKPEPKPGDTDGDGYIDTEDDCIDKPETYNGYLDEDGCPDDPDTDGDGIPDSKDNCELVKEDVDGYLDGDGCPDNDNDLDGIPDAKEAKPECVNQPEDPDGFQDEDGCPDPDNDGDQVPDLEDECPMVPGVKTGNRPGCPQKNTLVVVTDREIKITKQIHFAFNKAIIRPESYPVLDSVVQVLKENESMVIEVQGHTDNVGAPNVNKPLSQQRADAVRKYLIDKGIAAGRLTAVGYGQDKPLVPNDSEKNRALNRRVQFVRMEKKP
jgi:outer membrane protein OmpA-like peptidoglycan-associated protein